MIASLARTSRAVVAIYPPVRATCAIVFSMFLAVFYSSRDNLYNILWAVVFGFATLNILGLASRRMAPGHRGLSFGEMMAVMVVLVSIFLLGWELLGLLHIFPIKIKS